VFGSWEKIIENNAKTIYPSHGKHFNADRLVFYRSKFAKKPFFAKIKWVKGI